MPSDPGRGVTGDLHAAPRRLHPLTLLFEALDEGRALLLPALVGGVWAGGGHMARMTGWVLAILVVPSVLYAAAEYFAFRYRLADGELILDSGVFSRHHRVIPLARVQSIDVRQSALQRFFGVTELHVETAGGDTTEAVLSVLGLEEAEALRAELLRHRSRSVAEGAAKAAPTVLARLSPRDLVLAGATANEAGVIAAFLIGAVELAYQLPIDIPLPRLNPWTLISEHPGMHVVLASAGVVLFLLLLGWLFSIAGAVLSYYGFTLERRGGELRKHYGRLNRRETEVPLERVQAIRVEESLLRRPLGLAALKIETAGAAPGENQRGGAEAFLPLARSRDVPRLTAAVFGDLDYGSLRFRPVHPRARTRAFARYSAPLLVLAAALILFLSPSGLWLLALVPFAYGAAHLHYRNLGYALVPGYVVARAGFLNRITWIVPERKVQTLHVRETPFQRRHGLATLVVDTAAGAARVVDLGRDEALALLAQLAGKTHPELGGSGNRPWNFRSETGIL
ncbi:MAG: PH domain-containing protein [Thermoanaerobaculia bacterium]